MVEPAAPTPSGAGTTFVRGLGARLRMVIGEPLDEILKIDMRRRVLGSSQGTRHLLPELLESSMTVLQEMERGRESAHLGDFVILQTVTETLERMSSDPGFALMRPGLADPARFRHDLVTLGYVDLLRRETPYTVTLPTDRAVKERSSDFTVVSAEGWTVEFETKAPVEFEGPTKLVSADEARKAVEKSWDKAVGRSKQLKGGISAALLLGGVTMNLQSLLTIQRAAIDFLDRRGARQPNFWGVIPFTMVVMREEPKTTHTAAGPGFVLGLQSRVQTAPARNPHYAGKVEIVAVRSKLD